MKKKSGKFIICLLVFTFFAGAVFPDQTLKIIFAGDVMGHLPVIRSAWNEEKKCYDFSNHLKYMKPYVMDADIAVANLETTLGGRPFRGYPMFSSPDELAEALKNTGFDILQLANNHCFDRMGKGLARTIDILDRLEIAHTGTFKNTEDRDENYPLTVKKNGITLSILNCTYSTNGIKVDPPFKVNMIDEEELLADLEKSKEQNPDFIIVTIHWGDEYNRNENEEQKRIAEFLLNNGADAIIGSHPHVVQPIGLFHDEKTATVKPVVYSLGNFISNQRSRFKDGGIVFELNLRKKDKTVLTDFNYSPFWVHKYQHEGKSMFSVIPVKAFLKSPHLFCLSSDEEDDMLTFYSDIKKKLKGIGENTFYDNFNLSEPDGLERLPGFCQTSRGIPTGTRP